MSLSQSPSETSTIPEVKKLSSEAQARVDATVNAALKILDSTPEMKDKLQAMFDTMVSRNMRDPENIKKLQDGLYDSHAERIKNLKGEERKNAINSFTTFIEKFSHNLAYMHRDINWDNELIAIQTQFREKSKSIQITYHSTFTKVVG